MGSHTAYSTYDGGDSLVTIDMNMDASENDRKGVRNIFKLRGSHGSSNVYGYYTQFSVTDNSDAGDVICYGSAIDSSLFDGLTYGMNDFVQYDAAPAQFLNVNTYNIGFRSRNLDAGRNKDFNFYAKECPQPF